MNAIASKRASIAKKLAMITFGSFPLPQASKAAIALAPFVLSRFERVLP
jgi:hypothetical protein